MAVNSTTIGSRPSNNYIFQELTQREIEYVALSRDTTESDLKQRREISSGSSHYINQVRFTILGKLGHSATL